MQCGLLGRKLGHSYSPQIHGALADYAYTLYEREPEQIGEFLKNGTFSGLNVTVPYKKDVIAHLDALTPRAAKLGAVNTIVRRDGKLIGHNTDYFGFETMVRACQLHVQGKKVLVLGSGGASTTAVAVLEEMGAKVVVISRNGQNHYGNLHLHQDAAVIVNTTPVGMYPNTGISPMDLDMFPHLEGVLDVIYNPARTKLILDAEERGIKAMNGLLMLVAQAKESAEWFTGQVISDQVIERIHKVLAHQMENIVLIGMPGCGKTTIGMGIAQCAGKEFADADAKIEELAGKPIPKIFAEDGEAIFRAWETKALEILGKQSGLVIATGGGCVTQQRNYPLLHQNGKIFWLRRDLDILPSEGRPLSQSTDIHQMYQTRKPMYQQFADHVIDNDGTVESAINSILSILEEKT